MKILIDMNLSPEWIPVLEAAGWAAKHWSHIGNPKAEDKEIFAWVATNGCIVFTHDLDFGAILAATGANRPSVFQVRAQDVLPESLASHVIAAFAKFREELLNGAIVTLDLNRSKVRILPIR